jgi:predicted deacylase
MIHAQTFSALKKGPKILIFGAIHGDEVCGPNAIGSMIKEFQSGKSILLKGSVTFVPIANPRAHAHNVRFTEENLNRVFRPTKTPRSYEARLANVLCGMVDTCDSLLDVHSTSGKGEPFIYLDFPTERNRAWAQVLGPKTAIIGWPELYETLGSAHRSYDTTAYAARKRRSALLIECGQHTDKQAAGVAHRAIRNTLKYYGLIAGAPASRSLSLVKMEHVFFHKSGERFAVPTWKHLDLVAKGSPLILRESAPAICAPYDRYIVMPFSDAPLGDDWLYFGKGVDSK